jgi:hypothetical protein
MLIKKASTVVHNLNETGLGIAREEEEEEEEEKEEEPYKLDMEEE